MFSKLLGLRYRIVYRSGTSNNAADALSHHPNPPAICNAVTSLVPNWIQAVIASYNQDTVAQDLLSKLALDSAAVPNFTMQSGLLRYRSHIWIGADISLQQHLISEFHASAWGGHSGVPVTYMRLKQCFASEGICAVLPCLSTIQI